MAGYGPGSPGGGYTSANNITVRDLQDAISIDPVLLEKIDRMDRNLAAVMERLSVLDEPSAEQLEKSKMLRSAYEKYKFAEQLCGKNND